MKTIFKCLAGLISAAVIAAFAPALYLQKILPDEYYISEGQSLELPGFFSLVGVSAKENTMMASATGQQKYPVNLTLFNSIPIKEVQVQIVPRRMVVPAGTPFGITMFTQGVMVVGMSDIQTGSNSRNPSKEAGIKIGDMLLSIDGNKVFRNEDIRYYVEQSEGQPLEVTVRRSGEILDLSLEPVQTEYDNQYRAGIWVRDSSAGIGTMTYFDPESYSFAGLGHAVCDVDTGRMMPLKSGKIVDVNISGAMAGLSGKPGELKGAFTGNSPSGELYLNTEMGIFGSLYQLPIESEAIPMANRQEVKPGEAVILSTISGNKPQEFQVIIEKVNYSDNSGTKNMVIRVVDNNLLSATGGIVQGMSGSPIVQDGKLVGAVTHVFVNDPALGYGIFAENMDKQLEIIDSERISVVNY